MIWPAISATNGPRHASLSIHLPPFADAFGQGNPIYMALGSFSEPNFQYFEIRTTLQQNRLIVSVPTPEPGCLVPISTPGSSLILIPHPGLNGLCKITQHLRLEPEVFYLVHSFLITPST